MKQSFDEFLQDKFSDRFPQILDDDLPDAYADWELDSEELMEYAEKYGEKQFIAGQLEGLQDAKDIIK